ncbi:uncharacterized protein LOC121858853 [Homarus americanus]|uniref:uncharacterized protein LOC121858853 n=1 Tax=Homarus americanus TaxID=6706 RepID=UPI001C4954D6|nr:uncharacterized protein LOC121858853 [Homarus americanus]
MQVSVMVSRSLVGDASVSAQQSCYSFFVCESIPHFAVAIELVGGLLVTPFIFIFPPAFHILIKHKASGRVDVRDVVLAANIMCLGAIGCIAATVESFTQVVKLKDFAPPCYINITTASAITDSTGFPHP